MMDHVEAVFRYNWQYIERIFSTALLSHINFQLHALQALFMHLHPYLSSTHLQCSYPM